MPDRSEAIDLLTQLQSQVATLQTSQIPQWRADVIEAINLIFGAGSTEDTEFRNIRFSPRDPAVVRLERFARSIELPVEAGDVTPSMDLAWERLLRERLQEADEFLTAVLVALRQQGS